MKTKKTPPHREVPSANTQYRGRPYRILGVGAVLALFVAVALVVLQSPRKLTEAERVQMRDYDQIRVALAHDNLESAKSAAAGLIRSDGGKGQFHDSAVVITQSDSLTEARSAFARMSEIAQRLVKGNAGFFIVGCAMARCPVKCSPCHMNDYADWVQADPSVENPFMGKSSPHCGVIKISY